MAGPALTNNRFLPRAQPVTSGPSPGGDSLVAVPNIAALQALDDTAVDDGGVVSVLSVRDLWMLDKTDATTPIDGITSVLPNSGVGRWNRMKLPALVWQLQTTWHIDEALGNDENDGNTAVTALSTWDEYQRRIGEGPLEVSHTVNFESTLTQDIHVNTAMIDDSLSITLQGVRSSPIYSGSVTGVQSENAGANVDLQITDAALPVSWTASGLVDKMYVLTSGPNAGACGWIAADVGAKTARITKAYNEGAGTFVEPGVGETFDIVDQGLVEGGLSGIEGGNVRVVARDLRFLNPGALAMKTEGGFWRLIFCDIDGGSINLSGSSQQSSNGAATAAFATRMKATAFILLERATGILYSVLLASGITMRTHGTLNIRLSSSILQYASGPGFIRVNGGSRMIVSAPFGVFGLAAAGNRAIFVTWNGIAILREYVFGFGNTFDYAFEVGSGSSIIYDVSFLPVVTAGAIADTLIGNLNRNYIQLPVSNNGRNCAFVLE
jgi:hypothetical protein